MTRRTLPSLALALLAAALPAAANPGHVERVEHHDVASAPSRGPLNALVTIEIFFVPGSSSIQPLRRLQALQTRHPSRIRLVYRVVASGGQVMVPSALLEAHAQGHFFEMLDAIQSRTTRVDRPALIEMATRVGLDIHRVVAAMTHGPDALDDNAARLRRFHRQTNEALFNGVPLTRSLAAATDGDLETAYKATLDRAEDMIDRGAEPSTLSDAFEQEALASVDVEVQPSGETDDDVDVDVQPADPPLATPPLALTGLPTFGRPDAPLPIVLLCSPVSTRCRGGLDRAMDVQRVYPELVRVVWAPWYDVARPDAVDLALLADAALCAEVVGTAASTEGEVSSSGWRWVTGVLDVTYARRGRRVPAVDTIDQVAKALHVDEHAFAACRAGQAGTAVERIAAARHSGVRAAPTLMVGGRLYLRGLPDAGQLQRLVEGELAPGVLGQLAPSWVRPTVVDSPAR